MTPNPDTHETTASQRSAPPAGSAVRLVVTGNPLTTGASERMATKIQRLGIMRQRHCCCPKCGNQVEASDGFPIIKPKYRYSVACQSCDEMVFGHTVESVCRQWVNLYPQNEKSPDAGATE